MKKLNIQEDFSQLLNELKRMYSPDRMSEAEIDIDIHTKRVMSIIMSAASLLLTTFNIVNKYWFMAVTTGVMAIIFAICVSLSNNPKNRKLVVMIMSLTLGFIFTYYAISGQNDGFAILWILLVPLIGMLVLGVKAGTYISTYFLLLLLFIFYSPYRDYVKDYYTSTFMIRFPVLYFVGFVASIYVTMRKEHYKIITENMAETDLLTSIGNRRYYEDSIKKIEKIGDKQDLVIFMIDVNRLKFTNDKYGHQAGDKLLIDTARYLQYIFDKPSDIICRNGGDEFAVVTRMDSNEVELAKDKITKFRFEYEGQHITEPSLSVGVALANENEYLTVYELEKIADMNMYSEKENYYRISGIDRRKV